MRAGLTLFLFACLLAQSCAFAQTFKLSGTAVQFGQGTPLKKLKIVVDGKLKTETDSAGKYLVSSLSAGGHELKFILEGFKTIKEKIKINADTVLNIFMIADSVTLDVVEVEAEKENDFGIGRMNNVEGTTINAGKKSEVVTMKDINGNMAANNARQMFSKVAGLNIFENDGSGIQMSIGGRGLNPNRISNFNTRQNGYDISADALGYPESYYTPPAEAIEKIEILRGAASLQYGTQFGGLVNFVMKEGAAKKKLEALSSNTYGSFNFFSSFNSVGGTAKKFNYYVCHQFKRGDGSRPNSKFTSNTSFASVKFQATENLKITLDYTLMNYLSKQPGGLTDKMFNEDPFQSTRSRNWFRVNWNLLSLKVNLKTGPRSQVEWSNYGLKASRGALGVLNQTQYKDPYDLYLLGLYSAGDPALNRNLLWDDYLNFGSEFRYLLRYRMRKENISVFLAGVRYYKGTTQRKQGSGNASTGPDFYFLDEENPDNSAYTFPSLNQAVFVENIFQLNKKFSVTPGLRFENISTSSNGYYNLRYYDFAGNLIYEQKVNDERNNKRHFLLGGLGLMYKHNSSLEFYGNFSQNYRSINFNDMRVANPNLVVDPALKDETGFTSDGGMRYSLKKKMYVDVSLFYMQYNGRIGTVLQSNNTRLRTNISDSRNMGAEIFAEADFLRMFFEKVEKHSLSLFTNLSLIDARYINSKEKGFENNFVELVPSVILRNGITYKYKAFKTCIQSSYVSEQYSDASNANYTGNGIAGLIPAYWIMDFSVQYSKKHWGLNGGVNNFTNQYYFTRRAEGYPGPGIIPSDPINFYLTFQLKF
jgi:Fe(3+) dicitrate transport protein